MRSTMSSLNEYFGIQYVSLTLSHTHTQTELFCLFLIIHACEECCLSFVFVSWHVFRCEAYMHVYSISVSVCFFNCAEIHYQLNATISLLICRQRVHLLPCTCSNTEPHQFEAAAFLFSPNQSEEPSVTMSLASRADGLFKSATDNSSSAATLPHALIASNEVMKETRHSQPELSCFARCSSTCLCRMSGN